MNTEEEEEPELEQEPVSSVPSEQAPEHLSDSPELESNIFAEIAEMLEDAIPECEICENSPQLIEDALILFMDDIIAKTNCKKSKITVNHIQEVLENYPEYHFLLNMIKE